MEHDGPRRRPCYRPTVFLIQRHLIALSFQQEIIRRPFQKCYFSFVLSVNRVSLKLHALWDVSTYRKELCYEEDDWYLKHGNMATRFPISDMKVVYRCQVTCLIYLLEKRDKDPVLRDLRG